MSLLPRILVTGFSVFPGAPVNPTEALVERWRVEPPVLDAELRVELLAVEYASIAARLEAISSSFRPDIAIHFGLARECAGFRLERLARNEIAPGRPDNAGLQPDMLCMYEDGENCVGTLPLDEIAACLQDARMLVSWSDDAGGYLCNYLFYLSVSPRFQAFAPDMAGFIHVPPLAEAEPGNPSAMSLDMLEKGAGLIVETCARRWRADRHHKSQL